jgi:hypothetical protein
MPSAFATNNLLVTLLLCMILGAKVAYTQENTPWSRYGLGDPIQSSNISNRGMGYVSIGYNDPQTVNFNNPASYSRFGSQRALLDIGVDYHTRTMQNQNKKRVSFSNVYVPYISGGFQLKGEKRKRDWGIAFGLKPLTRVSYNIETGLRKGSDSITYNYEGNGGLYQAFLGTGMAFKNLSIGINLGYRFGSKDNITRVSMLNDSLSGIYTSGQKEVKNTYGGVFAEFGVQYEANISNNQMITFGAVGGLSSSMFIKSEEKLFTYFQPGDLSTVVLIDSAGPKQERNGRMTYPSHFGIGCMYDRIKDSRLSIGMDFTFQNWTQYRIYDQPDLLNDAWQIKSGLQWIPAKKANSKKSKRKFIYRGGMYYTQEPYVLSGNVNSYGFTIGIGVPVKKYSYTEYNKNNIVNIALEFGRRGSSSNIIIENYFRIAVGMSFSDIWFIKSKYD